MKYGPGCQGTHPFGVCLTCLYIHRRMLYTKVILLVSIHFIFSFRNNINIMRNDLHVAKVDVRWSPCNYSRSLQKDRRNETGVPFCTDSRRAIDALIISDGCWMYHGDHEGRRYTSVLKGTERAVIGGGAEERSRELSWGVDCLCLCRPNC